MKNILYSSFFSVLIFGLSFGVDSLHAATCSNGSTNSTAGMVLQGNGCYQDGSGNQYSYASTSQIASNAQVIGTSIRSDEDVGVYYDPDGRTTWDKIKNGNFTLSDIPILIVSVIESLLQLVATICVVAIIYHAVRMQLASGILGDSSGVDKAKKGIYSAIMGFVLSMSAWFIMTKMVAIFGGIT